jgi:hypothetical protein
MHRTFWRQAKEKSETMRKPTSSIQPLRKVLSRRASFAQIKTGVETLLAVLMGAATLSADASAQTAGSYQATNLISDGSVAATTTDPNFINPWGVSNGPGFWINTQNTGLDYVTDATGKVFFTVKIPAASGTGTGSPTGTVFNSSSNLFMLSNGSAASFLFSSLDGTISGWDGALGTANSVAQIAINNSANNAVYTDMALLTNSTGTFILAANFGQGTDIEVYNSSFKAATLAGSFTDPTLPANYAPFAVHTIGSQVFVTYALRTSTTPTGSAPSPYAVSSSSSSPRAAASSYTQTVGAGNGIVDVFDLNGNFVKRAIDVGGNLNAPWGVALAPTGYGIFGGDLLVGNFGDGIINVYNPTTFAFLGQLTDATGKALSYPSLWEISFGESNATPAGAGDPNTLYIAAGLANEAHGLFAGIANTTGSTAAATFGFSASTSAATVAAGSSATATISAAPTNGFSGSVTLACTGPAGVTCSFSPSQLTVSPTAAATSTVTIQTTASMAKLQRPSPQFQGTATIAAAFLLPFGSLLVFSRRRSAGKSNPLQLLGLFALLLVTSGLAIGCSSYMAPAASAPAAPAAPATPGTPNGVQQVTITATSGNIIQSTAIALTVK